MTNAVPLASRPRFLADRPSSITVTDPDTSPGAGLAVADLTVTFRKGARTVRAVRGVTFEVPRGRALVLLGESGSGKSVTARAILRLYGPGAEIGGTVRLGDRDLVTMGEDGVRSIRGKALGFVPQDSSGALDPLRHVGAQIAEVLRCHHVTASRKEAKARSVELLHTVGIPDPVRAARSFPHELSGGMRQRALIAIGIACGPDILIADEPTTALDVTVQAQILDLFGQLQAESGMGLLLVTHDIGVAQRMADHVAVMYAGRLVEEGPGSTVLDEPIHPYTRGLLGAVPSPTTPRGRLQAIPGTPPSAADLLGSACAFAPRCPDVTDECGKSEPPLLEIGRARRSACPVTASDETPVLSAKGSL